MSKPTTPGIQTGKRVCQVSCGYIASSNSEVFISFSQSTANSWRFASAMPNPFHRLVRLLRFCHSLELARWHRLIIGLPNKYDG